MVRVDQEHKKLQMKLYNIILVPHPSELYYKRGLNPSAQNLGYELLMITLADAGSNATTN